MGLLLADLGVTKTHSRPYVSNDNPYSEAQFKTMKYCPQFPSRFGSAEDGPAILLRFLRLLQFPPPALGNRPYDTGRRSLWSRRTAHRPLAVILIEAQRADPERSFAERRNRPFCLRRPGSTRRRKKRRSTMPHKPLSPRRPYRGYPLFLLHATRSWSMLTSIAPTSRVSPP